MKKITIRKGILMGATIGAFLYTYYINFNGNYYYTFQATEEGMMHAVAGWKAGGAEVIFEENKLKQ